VSFGSSFTVGATHGRRGMVSEPDWELDEESDELMNAPFVEDKENSWLVSRP